MVLPFARGLMPTIAARGARLGWTTTRIIAEARRLGVSYRRTTMLKDIRTALGREPARTVAQATPRKYRPGVRAFSSTEWQIKQPYVAQVQLRGYSRITGERWVKDTMVSYKELPSVREIEEVAYQRYSEGYAEEQDVVVESATFVGGLRRA